MKLKGKITDIIHNDFNCGMVTVPKIGKIFFSPDTAFSNAKFEDLKVGDSVLVECKETSRGLFASSLENVPQKAKNLNTAEVTL